MNANKIIVLFLIACILFYGSSGTAAYAEHKAATSDADTGRQQAIALRKAARRDSAYRKNEFLDTVMKGDRISYNFMLKHTLLTGSDFDTSAEDEYNNFNGHSVYDINKRFAMAVVYHNSHSVGGEYLLFVIDLQTNKNTDWVKGGYSYDSDGEDQDGSSRDFELKHDTVLVIEDISTSHNKKGQLVAKSEKHVLHINREGKLVGNRPD